MRRAVAVAVIVILAALDWAALHDILVDEPNPWMEWAMLALSLPTAALALWWGFIKQRNLNAG